MTLPLLVPDWPAPPNVRAAMTTRNGGVSVGPYATLNMGRSGGDDPAAVDENRRRVFAALQLPSEPHWLRQVHGAQVARMSPYSRLRGAGRGEGLEADASYTTEPDTVCVVQAADCLPVLLCDESGSVVAAAHAGWRGLCAGVLEAAVRALPAPPGTLIAWLGAAIGPESFEVGTEVRAAFVQRDAIAASHFRPRREKFLADLYGLARQRLAAAGVTRVHGGGRCTYRESNEFFSYRRDGRCGRMAALIWRIG